MLKLTDVTLRRGTRLLFEKATLTLHAGQKVGVVGANGAGKSSLFSLFRGELAPDAGEFSLPPQWVIAHVAQETPAVDGAAIDYVLDGDAELRRLERECAEAERADDGLRLAVLHGQFEAIGGYGARSRAARLMHGLGFGVEEEERPVASFSGGWRMRLNLARALMCRSDLLLLDEPTNHLDLEAVIWLEEWLRVYPGMLLLISHDREVLDNVVHHTVHLAAQRLDLYAGNYSDFEIRRAERLAGQQSAFERQQREVERIRSFVDRFRAKATKARQAQSRLKQLARMELLAPAHADSPFRFSFREPLKLPNPLLRIDEKGAVDYGGARVLSGIEISLCPGARIGLLGPNGAGKSTFIKLLAGTLTPSQGRREAAADLRVGYFAQHQLEQLREEQSPLWHLRQRDPKAPEQDLRDLLGGFGFAGDRALEPVAPLSGGEKARLVLALVIHDRPNLLLLDEPTNHLDIEMRHALTIALQEFEGAMVVVSHDRHLLRGVTDQFWLVSDGTARVFDGDLDDYRTWLAKRTAAASPEVTPNTNNGAAVRKERRREEAEKRQRLQPLRKEMQRLESLMEKLNGEKTGIAAQLADPALYLESEKERFRRLLLEQARIDKVLGEAEESWLALGERLDAAESEC